MRSVIHTSALLKRMCLSWAILLIALLAMGPFLHAHFGSSTVTGLHVAGVTSMGTQAPMVTDHTTLSQDDEPESAALGVETSYARQLVIDVQDEPQTLGFFTRFELVIGASSLFVAWCLPSVRRHRRATSWAGMPPPAHAPPALSL